MSFLPRDFIVTHEGLIFSVMNRHLEDNRILGFLRYICLDGHYRKLNTQEANDHLAKQNPEYLFVSKRLAAQIHGVPVSDICHHYQPRTRLQQLLGQNTHDPIEQTALTLCRLLESAGLDLNFVGITGSLLIGAQRPGSDIDLVLYERLAFYTARLAIDSLIAQGTITNLSESDWRDAYARRDCALSFEEYLWHEQRKRNKGMVAGIKFDISLTSDESQQLPANATKSGYHTLRVKVIDTLHSFDYPAIYRLDHPEVFEAWSFIQTYAGQAVEGEWVEIKGLLETSNDGVKRIVVGSSREAPGEYIKVIRHEG